MGKFLGQYIFKCFQTDENSSEDEKEISIKTTDKPIIVKDTATNYSRNFASNSDNISQHRTSHKAGFSIVTDTGMMINAASPVCTPRSNSDLDDGDQSPLEGLKYFCTTLKTHPPKFLMSPKTFLEKPESHYLLGSELKLLPTNIRVVKSNFSKVALVSYPGSGESLLRSYLEEITKIFIADDCQQEYKLNPTLNKVWVVNTHFPLQRAKRFKVNKAVVLIRDPIETLVESKKKVVFTDTLELNSIRLERFDKDDHLDEESFDKWARFYNYWINPKRECLTYYIQYKDLTNSPEKVLKNLFCFLIGCSLSEISGTVLEKLIRKQCEKIEPPPCNIDEDDYYSCLSLLESPNVSNIISFMDQSEKKPVVSLRKSLMPTADFNTVCILDSSNRDIERKGSFQNPPQQYYFSLDEVKTSQHNTTQRFALAQRNDYSYLQAIHKESTQLNSMVINRAKEVKLFALNE
ncbi:unnamed protein product [Moneuplotes crassus]|uniref:Sulfotransferase domain-containing protein n=1 Tax=Euplotes crassus TaxID=5936 RepID=A0AAD1UG38_EUPCR|nr:unnamed protein product [Moneuplotes crassus]